MTRWKLLALAFSAMYFVPSMRYTALIALLTLMIEP